MAASTVSTSINGFPALRSSRTRRQISSSSKGNGFLGSPSSRTRRSTSPSPDQPGLFHYRPLDETSQEIRLLSLLDGAGESPISLTLEYASLSAAAGRFIAFSYCWGPPHDAKEVIMDGRSIRIRQNLWLFLHNYRECAEKAHRRLWIDYLCIDQSNKRERGHQVRLMAEIFSNASTVYAWLGEATPDTDVAIGYIKLVLSTPKNKFLTKFSTVNIKEGQRALRTLVDREYWSRLWIIQELVLSRKIFFIVGNAVIEWDHLAYVVDDAPVGPRATSNKASAHYNEASRQIFREIRYRKRTFGQFHRPERLCKLLPKFDLARCRNPRDRIYGLLGLTFASVRKQVIIDYSSPVIEICISNMQVIWDGELSRGILSAATLWAVIEWVFDDSSILFTNTLPSQIKSPLILRAELRLISMSFSSFDMYHINTASNEMLFTEHIPKPHHRFVTVAKDFFRAARIGEEEDEYAQGMEIYSTTHCRDWDFVLMLDTPHNFLRGNAILICRQAGNSYQIVEIGFFVWISYSMRTLTKSHLTDRMDPSLLARRSDSGLGCSLLEAPTLATRHTWGRFYWNVEFDNRAVAELISTMNSVHSPSIRLHYTHIRHQWEKKSYPRLLFPFLFAEDDDEKASENECLAVRRSPSDWY